MGATIAGPVLGRVAAAFTRRSRRERSESTTTLTLRRAVTDHVPIVHPALPGTCTTFRRWITDSVLASTRHISDRRIRSRKRGPPSRVRHRLAKIFSPTGHHSGQGSWCPSTHRPQPPCFPPRRNNSVCLLPSHRIEGVALSGRSSCSHSSQAARSAMAVSVLHPVGFGHLPG